MSTDEYSQDLPDEMYMQQASSVASMPYPNVGSLSGCSQPMPGNMDMSMISSQLIPQGQEDLQNRQKRKYTRRKQPEERKKRGPRTKDLNAPKMPLNGYVRFLNASRERIKQENPELSFADVTKKLASEWSSMTTDEKKVYLDEAEKAKEMYMKELHAYQQTESYQDFLNMKQRAKQQQPSLPATPMAPPSPSQSPMPMQMQMQMPPAPSMYAGGQQYYSESGPPQGMHPSQYAAMSIYQQQQQQLQQQQQQHQAYPYGMNGDSKMMAQCMPGGGLNGPYIQQQQYYPSPAHSSVASDYGNMSCSSQYQPRFHSPYGNGPPNGMPPYHMNAISNNNGPIEINGQMSNQGNDGLYGSNSLAGVLQKSSSILDLPIFTEEFLEHNKMREQELRSTRALTMEYEEENAILSKHVDDMTVATEKLIQEEAKERETNAKLNAVWAKLQHNLVEHFQEINLPFSEDSRNFGPPCFPPSLDNFDHYVDELEHFRFQALTNGNQYPITEPRYEPLVQSIETAVKAIDAVTF